MLNKHTFPSTIPGELPGHTYMDADYGDRPMDPAYGPDPAPRRGQHLNVGVLFPP